MSNPFASALGGPGGQQKGPMNMMQAFQQFMNQNRGKDPNELKNEMISAFNLNQNQLNQVQQVAKQVEGQLNGMKSMFGFK